MNRGTVVESGRSLNGWEVFVLIVDPRGCKWDWLAGITGDNPFCYSFGLE